MKNVTRNTRWLPGLILALAAASIHAAQPQETKPADKAEKPAVVKPAKLIYKPPRLGAPKTRVGGGTRGTIDGQPAVYVLAPDHTGLTTQAQPTLYWYLSHASTLRVELSLITQTAIEPVVEKTLPEVQEPGMHAFDLAHHDVTLEPGQSYQWSVALVTDPQQRSKDILASGAVERVMLPPELDNRLDGRSNGEQAVMYLKAGIWYDGFDALASEIVANPDDRILRAERKRLLEEVGLAPVATQLD